MKGKRMMCFITNSSRKSRTWLMNVQGDVHLPPLRLRGYYPGGPQREGRGTVLVTYGDHFADKSTTPQTISTHAL